MNMISLLMEMVSYSFIVRALLVGCMVSLCASLLGVSLVLKNYSMIGDGLSHVSFGALSVAVACGWSPLQVSIPVVVIAAVALLRLEETGKIKSDAAIAVVSSGALAVGVTVTSLTTGMNLDVYSYMFGSILAMRRSDVAVSTVLCLTVLVLFLICYHKIFAITFDETFAKTVRVRTSFYNTLIAVLTAVTIVLGMQMMGALLISSLIIFPSLISMRVMKSFRGVVICSAAVSVAAFFIGMILSYGYGTPAGASVVLVNLAFLIVFSLAGKIAASRRRHT